jgi:MFS family permease
VRRLAAARIVSSGGSQAAQIALVYELSERTGSGLWVVAALFASISAGGLLGPLSGWVADRYDRRVVMVVSEIAAGLAYFALVFARAPLLLVAGALAATVLGAPFRAASAAAVPNLVEPIDLAWANGVLATAFNVALVIGPFVGGALVAASGASLVFAVNTVSFLVSAAVIAWTPGRFGGHAAAIAARAPGGDRAEVSPGDVPAGLSPGTVSPGGGLAGVSVGDGGASGEPSATGHGSAGSVLAGFRLLVRHPLLGLLGVASALAYAAFGAALVIDPELARQFDAGSVGYGLLTTVWGGGAVLGAMVAGRTVTPSNATRAVVFGMAAMAISLGGVVVLPTFVLIVAAGAIGGIGNGFVFVPWLLLVQHLTADAVRARVIAAAEAIDQVAFLGGMGLGVVALALVTPQHAYTTTASVLVLATLAALGAWRAEARRSAAGAPR